MYNLLIKSRSNASDSATQFIVKLLLIYNICLYENYYEIHIYIYIYIYMSSEKEYGRPYQRNEAEILEKIIIKFVYRQIESSYPQKLPITISDKHTKVFKPHTVERRYDSNFKCKNQPYGFAGICLPIQLENYEKIKKFEKDGNKFNGIYKIAVITYNSIKD